MQIWQYRALGLAKTTWFFFLCVFWAYSGFAQNYIHYATTEGVPSDELYNGLQDQNGFILINSKDGLIRFDGDRFKLFTIKDGLTDNEILMSKMDRDGQVWLQPFHRSACIYKDGQISNSTTNPLLKTITDATYSEALLHFGLSTKGNIVHYQISRKDIQNVLSVQGDAIHKTTTTGSYFSVIETDDGLYCFDQNKYTWYSNDGSVITRPSNFFLVYEFVYHMGFYYCIDKRDDQQIIYKLSIHNGVVKEVAKKLLGRRGQNIDEILFVGDTLFLALKNTIFSCGTSFQDWQLFYKFDEDIDIRGAFFDRQKNLWVITRSNGIYLFPKTEVFTKQNKLLNSSDAFKAFMDTSLVFVSDRSLRWYINSEKYVDISLIHPMSRSKKLQGSSEGVYFLDQESNIVFYRKNEEPRIYSFLNKFWAIKDLEVHTDFIAVALSDGVLLMNRKTDSIQEIVGRATTLDISQISEEIYVGTLKGVYKLKRINTRWEQEWIPDFLGERVVKLREDQQGILWVMLQNKIKAFYKSNIIATIDHSNGLLSPTLNNLSLSTEGLVISTNAGVNLVRYKLEKDSIYVQNIENYTKENGLLDHYIKQAEVYNNQLIIRTNKGSQTIDLKKTDDLLAYMPCVVGLMANKKTIDLDSLNLKHWQNNITIEFASLLYGNRPNEYNYRLKELSTVWRTTNSRVCEFYDLAPGDYTFEIKVSSKDLKKSGLVRSLKFKIQAAFWQTLWFKLLIGFVILMTILYYLYSVYKRKSMRLKFEKSLAQLRMQSLKAQMNPHFIFNSLNSIQSVVNTGDLDLSNKYIVQFSTLIRHALNYSSKESISLKEEIDFLHNYIQLERYRFENKFEYSITVSPELNTRNIFLPPMFLQIYIENAIKHGILPLSRIGKVSIGFEKKEDVLICSIDDNGVGRSKTVGSQYKVFTSRGTRLNEERIEAYNIIMDDNIQIQWTDKNSSEGEAIGTLVEIKIPIK